MSDVLVKMVEKRWEENKQNVSAMQAWHDIRILLSEIHERDILISDFREQRVKWKEDVDYYRNLYIQERDKNRASIEKVFDAIKNIEQHEHEQGVGARYEFEQVLKEWKEAKEN